MPSKIEWTQHTWNPVTGCTKVSAGCQNCYAENMARRFGGKDGFKVTLHPDKLDIPLKRKKSTIYFVCSMSDLFHEDIPDDFIILIFNTMANAHALYGHTFQVLTKRPERMQNIIKKIETGLLEQRKPIKKENGYTEHTMTFSFPLQGIWLGVTAENQKEANSRIPILLDIPAVLRFVSVEPMLEKIAIHQYLNRFDCPLCGFDNTEWDDSYTPTICPICDGDSNYPSHIRKKPSIDWVICGGESGQRARPLSPLWIEDLQKQCAQTNTPFFFKQWGEFTCKDGEIIRVGKKEAGYLINEKEYREMPKIYNVAINEERFLSEHGSK